MSIGDSSNSSNQFYSLYRSVTRYRKSSNNFYYLIAFLVHFDQLFDKPSNVLLQITILPLQLDVIIAAQHKPHNILNQYGKGLKRIKIILALYLLLGVVVLSQFMSSSREISFLYITL